MEGREGVAFSGKEDLRLPEVVSTTVYSREKRQDEEGLGERVEKKLNLGDRGVALLFDLDGTLVFEVFGPSSADSEGEEIYPGVKEFFVNLKDLLVRLKEEDFRVKVGFYTSRKIAVEKTLDKIKKEIGETCFNSVFGENPIVIDGNDIKEDQKKIGGGKLIYEGMILVGDDYCYPVGMEEQEREDGKGAAAVHIWLSPSLPRRQLKIKSTEGEERFLWVGKLLGEIEKNIKRILPREENVTV